MSKPVFFNSKVVYHDNSREYHIDARGKDLASVMRALEADDVEPIAQEEPLKEENRLPFFVPEKLAALGTYSIDEFDTMYHDAVKGGAPKLAKFLKRYKELEVFDTGDLNKKETYEELKAYFGAELDFGYPNFAVYY